MHTYKFSILIFFFIFSSCSEPVNKNMLVDGKGISQRLSEHLNKSSENYKYDSLFVDKQEYIVESFGVPVGYPDAKGYSIQKKFWTAHHLGDDWSLDGEGNADFGDTIYAIANGYVSFAEDAGFAWGGIVRIIHKIENKRDIFMDTSIVHQTAKDDRKKYLYIESFYAHCNEELIRSGQWVKKGDPIATIGDAGGRFLAHLHLEIRTEPGTELNIGGYAKYPDGFINPERFMMAYNGRD